MFEWRKGRLIVGARFETWSISGDLVKITLTVQRVRLHWEPADRTWNSYPTLRAYLHGHS